MPSCGADNARTADRPSQTQTCSARRTTFPQSFLLALCHLFSAFLNCTSYDFLSAFSAALIRKSLSTPRGSLDAERKQKRAAPSTKFRLKQLALATTFVCVLA